MPGRTPAALAASLAAALLAAAQVFSVHATVQAAPAAQTATQFGTSQHATLLTTFLTAWNTHDVTALLTTITPDVVVRQRKAHTTARPTSVEVADLLGRRSVLADPSRLAPDDTITWAAGWQELAEWAKDLFQDDHRLDADLQLETPDLVRLAYRARVTPYRQMAGVEPPQGTIEATVRAGKFSSLTLESGPDAVARRDAAMTYALLETQSRAAARWTETHAAAGSPPVAAQPIGQDTQSRAHPLPTHFAAPAVLALAATALLALTTGRQKA